MLIADRNKLVFCINCHQTDWICAFLNIILNDTRLLFLPHVPNLNPFQTIKTNSMLIQILTRIDFILYFMPCQESKLTMIQLIILDWLFTNTAHEISWCTPTYARICHLFLYIIFILSFIFCIQQTFIVCCWLLLCEIDVLERVCFRFHGCHRFLLSV